MSAVVVNEPVTLGPLDRLEALCDPGSLHVIRSGVSSRRMGDRARAGDGVVGAAGRVDGRPVFAYAQDMSFIGGSLGEQHADTIVRVLELAGQAQVPVVGFVASAGARMQEGVGSLAGYGRIFRQHVRLSGRVPQISVIAGTSAGGGSYSPALTDFVLMTRDASMFLTGPAIVKEVMGEDVDANALGGARVHERNGVCHNVVDDDLAAAHHVARTCCRSSRSTRARSRRRACRPTRMTGDPGDIVPADPRKVYDVRDVVARVVDARRAAGDLAALGAQHRHRVRPPRRAAPSASSPTSRAGSAACSTPTPPQKAARFVRTCNTFGLPLLVFVDTPGLHAGHRAGAGRRDPPRRQAAARVRRGRRCRS